MSLESDIRAWDGKSAHDIASIYSSHQSSVRFLSRLIGLAAHPELERGATWLLKRGIETGDLAPTAVQTAAICQLCKVVADWGAGLHIMQCFPHLDLPRSSASVVASFLDRQLTDRRAIVRAWAYWGYHELALISPRHRADTEALLLDAAQSETAGSVRARVRKALRARGLA